MRALLAVALVAAPAWAMNPFEKNHPQVEEGTEAYERQDFEHALEKYEAAAKERPQDARVQYDRGLALHKLGRDDEAKSALQKALELDQKGELAGKIHYNLGTIAAAANARDEAIREFRAALKKDPGDELARHNLEVLLKNLPPKSQSGPDGGTPDGGRTDGGQNDAGRPDAGPDGGATDAGMDAGRPDGGQPDGGGGDGGSAEDAGQDGGVDGGGNADGGQGDGGQGDAGQGDQQEESDGGKDGGQSDRPDGGGDDGGKPEPTDGGDTQPAQPDLLPDGGIDLSKQEAEKLLDSMKSNEKNLQLWRFRQKTKNSETNGKDW